MTDERSVEQVDEDLALALGLFALGDGQLHEAAAKAGITRWELEDAIERADLVEAFDIDRDANASSAIDRILEEN